MRFLPAGELLTSGGKTVKENSGWMTKFSVHSSEVYAGQTMSALGAVILLLSLTFLYLGRIDFAVVLWSGGSGLFLMVIGVRKLILQKQRMRRVREQYPYWHTKI